MGGQLRSPSRPHVACGSFATNLGRQARAESDGYWRFRSPHWTVNHGNSTSFYYKDPDGNEVETMMDNFSPLETQTYKRHYQFTDEFGAMAEGNFDPDKMVALYESGVPESVLLDREEVRRMVREGAL